MRSTVISSLSKSAAILSNHSVPPPPPIFYFSYNYFRHLNNFRTIKNICANTTKFGAQCSDRRMPLAGASRCGDCGALVAGLTSRPPANASQCIAEQAAPRRVRSTG